MQLNKIKKTIETVKELPTLPVVANKVNALLYDPKSAAGDLAKIIENDQSLTAKILTLVNSAYYGLSQRVTNITQAIALLGYKNISHMVMTLSVFETLKSSKHGSFDREDFWLHSISTATMSVKIAELCMYSSPEDTFTGGLLHDLGKVFMALPFYYTTFGNPYAKKNAKTERSAVVADRTYLHKRNPGGKKSILGLWGIVFLFGDFFIKFYL